MAMAMALAMAIATAMAVAMTNAMAMAAYGHSSITWSRVVGVTGMIQCHIVPQIMATDHQPLTWPYMANIGQITRPSNGQKF